MTAQLIDRAIWDDTRKQLGGTSVIQTGEQCVCRIMVNGIEFRTWLPNSKENALAMNAAAEFILERTAQAEFGFQ